MDLTKRHNERSMEHFTTDKINTKTFWSKLLLDVQLEYFMPLPSEDAALVNQQLVSNDAFTR